MWPGEYDDGNVLCQESRTTQKSIKSFATESRYCCWGTVDKLVEERFCRIEVEVVEELPVCNKSVNRLVDGRFAKKRLQEAFPICKKTVDRLVGEDLGKKRLNRQRIFRSVSRLWTDWLVKILERRVEVEKNFQSVVGL